MYALHLLLKIVSYEVYYNLTIFSFKVFNIFSKQKFLFVKEKRRFLKMDGCGGPDPSHYKACIINKVLFGKSIFELSQG